MEDRWGCGSGRDDGEGTQKEKKREISVEMVEVMVGGGGGGLLTAAPSGLPDGGALDFQVGLVAAGRGPGTHALLDLRSHGHESLLYVGGVLGARLQEGDGQGIGELLGCCVVHYFLSGQVTLVAHQKLVDIFTGIAVDFLKPLLDIVIGLLICHIIYNYDAMGSAVVTGGDGTKPLLTGGVPNLQFDGLAVQLDGADLKVHPNGADVALCVGVVSKTQQKTGLSYSRVSNKQELEQIVIFRIHGVSLEVLFSSLPTPVEE